MSSARSDDTGKVGAIRLRELKADDFERLYLRMREFARRYGASDDDSVQAIMLKALLVGDPGLDVGWFIRAVINHRITELRQQKVRSQKCCRNVPLDGCAEPPVEESLPLDNLVEEEKEDTVKREFAKLKPIDQEILRLTVFQGLNCLQAAEQLGITPAAARQRRHEALKRFKSVKEIDAIRHEILEGRARGHE
jgi:RNA polymerase sigma factor (sigma-70 family)